MISRFEVISCSAVVQRLDDWISSDAQRNADVSMSADLFTLISRAARIHANGVAVPFMGNACVEAVGKAAGKAAGKVVGESFVLVQHVVIILILNLEI